MEKKNCPNCGQPITGEKCQYCGTVFIDWALIDTDKPFYLKFRHNGMITRAKCIARTFDLTVHQESPTMFYSDNEPYARICPQDSMTITVEMDVIPEKIMGRETLLIKVNEDEVDLNDYDLQECLKEII